MKDYYSILQISKSADLQKIKQAYRKLAVQYHPDKSKDPSTAVKFIEITEAYEVLKDVNKRTQYDVLYNEYFEKSVTPVTSKQQEQAWKTYGEAKAKEYAAMSYADFDRLFDEIKLAVSYTPNFLFVLFCAFGVGTGFWMMSEIDPWAGLFCVAMYGVFCYFLYQRMKNDYIAERQKLQNKYKS